MEEKTFNGKVNNISVTGRSYREFIINYLTELAIQNRNFDKLTRIKNYIEYFLSNFSYNKELFNKVTTTPNYKESYEENQKSLFTLLHDGKGVCQQLAQAMNLLSIIDSNITKDMLIAPYVVCELRHGTQKYGHAINIVSDGSESYIIDISSMLHVKEGEFTDSKTPYDFCMKSFAEYNNNLKKENREIVPYENDGQKYLTQIATRLDPIEQYTLINLSTDELLEFNKSKQILYRYEVPNEETIQSE